MLDNLTASYDYFLPESLIAQRPVNFRHDSKLLIYNNKSSEITHARFHELNKFLPPKCALLLNNSKVFPCRLLGQKESGGKVEVFLLSLQEKEASIYPCLVRTTSKKKVGDQYQLGEIQAVLEKDFGDGSFGLSFSPQNWKERLTQTAFIPIPPYIRNGLSDSQDKEQYQTIYAQNLGSVAAPTAGLHFTKELLYSLEDQGHPLSYATLHVGLGTFLPVKTQWIHQHQMHEEEFFVSAKDRHLINKAQENIVAVGTTSLRVLQSLPQGSGAYQSKTSLFLYPGKKVNAFSGLITNFHLPQSSLLMLVSALIGREKTLELYQEAIKHYYRFYSYGDAMFLLL